MSVGLIGNDAVGDKTADEKELGDSTGDDVTPAGDNGLVGE